MAEKLGTFNPNTLSDAVERAEKCEVSGGLIAMAMGRLEAFGHNQVRHGSLEITLDDEAKCRLRAEIRRIDHAFHSWDMFL